MIHITAAEFRRWRSTEKTGKQKRKASPKPPQITEDEFLGQILELARMHGWRTAHFRASRTKRGWRTAVGGDGKGFPDLILVRGSLLIAAELKIGKNKTTLDQDAWLNAFDSLPCAYAAVWKPSDWPTIEKILKHGFSKGRKV